MDYKNKARIFMRKFKGRSDIYGKKWMSKDKTKKDGTPLVGYAPQCANFWEDVCHIKNKTGISCSECEHQKYNPVTEDVVIKHIKGEEEHIYYLIDPIDNTVNFSAIDFDCKPGKEAAGYTFEDVKLCSVILKDWGIPHAIARSTTNGFHLYVFYTEPIPANKPLAVTHQLFEELGWSERARLGIKPIPEIFPKQATVGSDGLGNGIKPPMIEPQIKKGRNCWVNEENVIIPADEQWQFFTDIPRCRPKLIDKVIEKYGIDCSLYVSGASVFRNSGGSGSKASNAKSALSGSNVGIYFEKMLEGCAAFRGIRDRVLSGEVLGHDEGFAMIHAAMSTFDGREWCHKHMSGWMDTESQMKQIEQSERAGYKPWSCATMQAKGICKPGTKCFEKRAPVDIENGVLVRRKDIPESQWPSPGPIRYAYGEGEDFIRKLKTEAKELKNEKDSTVLEGKLKEIVNRAKAFDEQQRRELEKHLAKLKLVKAKALRLMFSDMIIEESKKVEESFEDQTQMVRVGTDYYQHCLDGFGLEQVRYVKGKPKGELITRTTIDIQESVRMIDDEGESSSTYKGEIVCQDDNFRVPFEVPVAEWVDAKKLHERFSNLAVYRLNIANAKHMSVVSQAALEFCRKEKTIKSSVFRTTQGWYKGAYITPSVLVNEKGVKANDQYKVDLSQKNGAREIDFQLVEEDELREVLFHVKSDLLNAFPKEMIYTGLSHAFLAGVRSRIGIKHKPTLWYEGLSGTGKSAITRILQSFYGPELGGKLPGWHTTARYLMNYVYDFKDCLAVIDDYKESMGPYIKKAAKEIVQFSYDDVIRGTLTRTGEAKEGKLNRALILSSGEDTPSQEASVIARMIIISCNRRDNSKTKEKFDLCEENITKYSCVTPYFISWFLQQEIGVVKKRLEENRKTILIGLNGVQNADRIVANLAMNMLGWQLFLGFCEDKGVMDKKEVAQFQQEHWDIINSIKFSMASRCSDEQQSNIFINTFKELLFSGKVRIENLNGYDLRESAPAVGFVKNRDDGKIDPVHKNRLYIWPDLATGEVLNALKSTGFTLNKKSLAGQLHDSGYITERSSDRFVKSVRYKRGSIKVWVFDLGALGLVPNTEDSLLKVVTPEDNTKLDEGGLL